MWTPWDDRFYPDGVRGWMAKVDTQEDGGLAIDAEFLVDFEDGIRPHQVRLHDPAIPSDTSVIPRCHPERQ